METKSKFKVGEKVALIGTVQKRSADYKGMYPLTIKTFDGEHPVSFNDEGRYSEASQTQSVFPLSELQQSEFPKWMLVQKDEKSYPEKRWVIGKHNNAYIVLCGIHDNSDLGMLKITDHAVAFDSIFYPYAADLPAEQPAPEPDYKALYEAEKLKLEKLERVFNEIKEEKQ